MKGLFNGTVMLVVGSSGLCSDKVGFSVDLCSGHFKCCKIRRKKFRVRKIFNVVKLGWRGEM